MAKKKLTLGNLHKVLFTDPMFMGKLSEKCKGSAIRLKGALDEVERTFAEEKGKK